MSWRVLDKNAVLLIKIGLMVTGTQILFSTFIFL